MIRGYWLRDGRIWSEIITIDLFEALDVRKLIWLDLLAPTAEEVALVDKKLGIELPTRQETEEIEFTSRYWEDAVSITINTYFFVRQDAHAYNETISCTVKDHFVVTVRFNEMRIFDDFSRKMTLDPDSYPTGLHVLSGILGTRIDYDADILEMLSREIATVGKLNSKEIASTEKFLALVTAFEHINITLRENLTDKQRILSSLLKSNKIPENIRREFTLMIKDVNSLVTSANFNFERLDYLQNLFLNFLSIEQNKVIKIFTVMSVIFLPPTLIASIYGMNFHTLPELRWPYGYPMAIGLIILSAILPLYVFRRKGWL
jgi:magnesium transporter